jgi:hypothetical protein
MSNEAMFQVEVLSLLGKLKAKREAVEQQLAAIDRQIEAVGLTAGLLRETSANGQIRPMVAEESNVSPQDVVGKTSREALTIIAKKNGGLVNISAAKNILLSGGVIKSRKNAWGAINTTLNRCREFEKEKPGWYRLKELGENRLPLQ